MSDMSLENPPPPRTHWPNCVKTTKKRAQKHVIFDDCEWLVYQKKSVSGFCLTELLELKIAYAAATIVSVQGAIYVFPTGHGQP